MCPTSSADVPSSAAVLPGGGGCFSPPRPSPSCSPSPRPCNDWGGEMLCPPFCPIPSLSLLPTHHIALFSTPAASREEERDGKQGILPIRLRLGLSGRGVKHPPPQSLHQLYICIHSEFFKYIWLNDNETERKIAADPIEEPTVVNRLT